MDEVKKKKKKSSPVDEDETLTALKKDLKAGVQADAHNREESEENLRFWYLSQWTDKEKKEREDLARPYLTVNIGQKYSKRVCGDGRLSQVNIKVRPGESKEADQNIASIYEGKIREIEYASDAHSIYDQARKQLIDGGYGAWRVVPKWLDEKAFEQELFIEGIDNPNSVFFTPGTKDFMFMDAKAGFVISKMNKETFKEKYPDVPLESFSDRNSLDLGMTQEVGKDDIVIAEGYKKHSKKKKIALLSDDKVMDSDEAKEYIAKMEKERETNKKTLGAEYKPVDDIPYIKRERETEEIKIKYYKFVGTAILEQEDYQGSIIPLVLVRGDRICIGGKWYVYGLLNSGRDAQRQINYWATHIVEAIAGQSKSTVLATPEQISGFSDMWARSNNENLAYLLYNPDPNAEHKSPHRLDPPAINQGIFAERENAKQDLKDCVGMYNTEMGDKGQEVSGAAQEMRAMNAEPLTFIWHDNMARAIAHTGKILVDMIPHIYDTAKEIRLRNQDETESYMPINMPAAKVSEMVQNNPDRYKGVDKSALDKQMSNVLGGGPGDLFNDLANGKYTVVVTTGLSFPTQRLEAEKEMLSMLSAGKASVVDKWLYWEFNDKPGAEKARKVYKKMLPAGLAETKQGEKPSPPMPPTPAMRVQMAKEEVAKISAQSKLVELRVNLIKLYKETKESEGSIRQEIIEVLKELHAPLHPSDLQMAQRLKQMAGPQLGGGQLAGGQAPMGGLPPMNQE